IYPVVGELLELYATRPIPEELTVGALLHDALEDDLDFTEARCREEFSDKILGIIKPLTKEKQDNNRALDQKEVFALNRKHVAAIARAPEASKLIKLADRYNNLSSFPAIAGTPKYHRYIRETEELFLPLAEKNSEFFYQKLKKKLEELKHMNV
ncbi:MAG: HD domain-containing protein, partial [Patescibacteria group bacterium]